MAAEGPATLEGEFLVEDVEAVVKSALQTVLSDTDYDSAKVAAWTNTVIDTVLKGLVALGRPFKYIVSCIIMQRAGGGLHTAAGAVWDAKKDGMCKMAWENKTIHCIVTVFGLATTPSPQATEA